MKEPDDDRPGASRRRLPRHRHAVPPPARQAPGRRGPGQPARAETALETLAATAAGEVEHVGGAARHLLGVRTGQDHEDSAPRAHAEITGAVATVALRLSVSYPAPVRAVTESVRTHLDARITALTGLTLHRLDLDVAALTTDTCTPGRRVS